VDPRPHAVGTLADTYAKYPTTGAVVPAMGYSRAQIKDLEATINATPADLVLVGTPIDLGHLLRTEKPALRVRYDLDLKGANLTDVLMARLGGRFRA
jgi:predicted GTPase